MWQEAYLVLHTPCRTLQESHSLNCSSQHFYTVTTWYTVFPSTVVSDIHNSPRVGNLTQLSSLKGEKTWEWAMSIGKSKYMLVGFKISWVVSPGFHKQNFPGFQIPLHGGKFPTYPSNWVIYRGYYMYYNKRYFVPQLRGDTFAQNLIFTKICYLLTFFYYMYM